MFNLISERLSTPSAGTRAAVDVTFDPTGLAHALGTNVQTAMAMLDAAISAVDIDTVNEALARASLAIINAAAAQDTADLAVDMAGNAGVLATGARDRANDAYALAEEALAAAGSGGRTFAYFVS